MNAQEALQMTKQAINDEHAALVKEANPLLEEIYAHIANTAQAKQTSILISSSTEYSNNPPLKNVALKMTKMGQSLSKVGDYIFNELTRQGYHVSMDGYGIRVSWKDAGKSLPRTGITAR